mgnify:CR=1 FL=1
MGWRGRSRLLGGRWEGIVFWFWRRRRRGGGGRVGRLPTLCITITISIIITGTNTVNNTVTTTVTVTVTVTVGVIIHPSAFLFPLFWPLLDIAAAAADTGRGYRGICSVGMMWSECLNKVWAWYSCRLCSFPKKSPQRGDFFYSGLGYCCFRFWYGLIWKMLIMIRR